MVVVLIVIGGIAIEPINDGAATKVTLARYKKWYNNILAYTIKSFYDFMVLPSAPAILESLLNLRKQALTCKVLIQMVDFKHVWEAAENSIPFTHSGHQIFR